MKDIFLGNLFRKTSQKHINNKRSLLLNRQHPFCHLGASCYETGMTTIQKINSTFNLCQG